MIARDGYSYIIGTLALAIASWLLGWPALAIVLGLAALFFGFFFRDPERRIPTDPLAIVSPADGKIVRIGPLAPGETDSPQVISIFLSVFDVHINRSPIAGRIVQFSHHPGKFLVASREAASRVNEQTHITVEGEHCRVVFKQIAGILARRILFRKSIGDWVEKGERVGMIKFGSRTDLILPPGARPLVACGEHVYGGSSILAKLS